MLEIILSTLERDGLMQIVKIIAYGFYQEPPLSEEQYRFLEKLVGLLGVNEDEREEIYTIDIRNPLSVDEIARQFKNSKALLFMLEVTSNIFNEKSFKVFAKEKVIKNLNLDKKNITKIIKQAQNYVATSEKIYSFLYPKKKSLLFFRRSSDANLTFQKVFFIDIEKLPKVERKEKIAFIKMLQYMMMDDNKIDKNEKRILTTIATQFNISSQNLSRVSEKYKGPHFDDCLIETEWLKRLLFFTFLFSQEKGAISADQERVKIIARHYGISEDSFKSLAKDMVEYNQLYWEIADTICSRVITPRPEEKGAEIGQRVFNMVGSATDVVINSNPIGIVGTLYKGFVSDQEICRNSQETDIDCGLVDMKEVSSSDTLLICINGFLTERGGQFGKWREALENIGYQGEIKGLKWRSFNTRDAITTGGSTWFKSVSNTGKAARQLVHDLKPIWRYRPQTKIILMGHSLGARVIHSALIEMHQSNEKQDTSMKVDDVFLFGGAVDSGKEENWAAALTSVQHRVYNFYSTNDKILGKFYKRLNDEPVGLKPIIAEQYKEFEGGELFNIDVTNCVKGHSNYLDNLSRLLVCDASCFSVRENL